MIKICELCAKEFETKNKKKRFCSRNCVSDFTWKIPENRKKLIDKLKKAWTDDRKEITSNSKKLLWKYDVYRNKMTEQSKILWSDTEYIKKTVVNRTDECRKKISDKAKERWNNPEFKEKMMIHFNSDKNKKEISYRFLNLWKNENYINSVIKNGKIYKKYTLPSGKIVNIQGYENKALDILLKKYKEDDIYIGISEINRIDSFFYNDLLGKAHRYFPDFYIKSENKIIEVKSSWTYNINFDINQSKMQCCLNKKYNFEFMIIN